MSAADAHYLAFVFQMVAAFFMLVAAAGLAYAPSKMKR